MMSVWKEAAADELEGRQISRCDGRDGLPTAD